MKTIATFFFIFCAMAMYGQKHFEEDEFNTPQGKLKITFIGHGTLMLDFNGTVIHVDPWTNLADYTKLPKADLILVTHEHGDHLDAKAIEELTKQGTELVYTAKCKQSKPALKGMVMKNGEKTTFHTIGIEAVPAYNMVNKRPDGTPFHPRGDGNGYILTLGGMRVYIAGDTENTPEMKALKHIDIAFLPMNLPYTMTPEMVADAAMAFKPKVLYPYHYGETDVTKLTDLLKNSGIEVRIRNMK